MGYRLCCITCLVKTRGHLSSSLHSPEGTLTFSSCEQFSDLPSWENSPSFCLMIRQLGGPAGPCHSPYPGSSPTLCSDPTALTLPLWLPGSTGPPGHCSPKVSLVVTQMLSEAISEHYAKQLVQKEYSANLVSQKAKKLTFVWLHSCKLWFLFWTVFGLLSSHCWSSSPWVTRAYVATSTTIKNVSVYPPRSSLYLHNYPGKPSGMTVWSAPLRTVDV